jgi:hypothetical protein
MKIYKSGEYNTTRRLINSSGRIININSLPMDKVQDLNSISPYEKAVKIYEDPNIKQNKTAPRPASFYNY